MKVRSKDGKNHIDGLSEADAQELIDGGTYEAVDEEPTPKTKAGKTKPVAEKPAAKKRRGR